MARMRLKNPKKTALYLDEPTYKKLEAVATAMELTGGISAAIRIVTAAFFAHECPKVQNVSESEQVAA